MPHQRNGRYHAPGSFTDGRRALRTANGTPPKGSMHARVNVCLTERQWAYLTMLAEGTDCSVSQIVREIIDGRLGEIEKNGELTWTGYDWAVPERW